MLSFDSKKPDPDFLLLNRRVRFFVLAAFSFINGGVYSQQNCLDFDGVDDQVELSNAIDIGTSDFSVEVWVKTTSGQNDPSIISDKNWGGGTNDGYVIAQIGNIWKFNIGDGAGNRADISSAGPVINDGAWHHLAVTVNRAGGANAINIYQDGINVGSRDLNGVGNSYSGLTSRIAQDGTGSYGQFWTGNIDEVRIWNDERTAAEVANNMCDISTYATEPNLVAYAKFDQALGSLTLIDLTGAHIGTLLNMDSATDWVDGVCRIMSIDNSNVTQFATSSVQNCENDAFIVRLEVTTTGDLSPLNVTQILLNMNGTTLVTDVANIDLYYTGTSSTFSTGNLFDNAPSAGGTINFNGAQLLSGGINYFWAVYDLNALASPGNVLDAEITQFTADAITYIPTTTSPVGNRIIEVCGAVPGNVVASNYAWYSAGKESFVDAGSSYSTDGQEVQQWNDLFSTRDLSQTSHNQGPIWRTASVPMNYNPSHEFGIVQPGCLSRGSYGFNTLTSPTNGTIYFVVRTAELSGWNTCLGFSLNDADDPFLGTINSSFSYHHDVEGGRYDHSVFTATTNESYILTYHWQTGTNGMNIGVNGVNEFTNGPHGRNFGPYFMIGSEDGVDFPPLVEVNKGHIPEAILYSEEHSILNQGKIESYLAIKYGITLGINGISKDYYSSAGNVIWSQVLNSAYAFDVAGIHRDDNSQLNQLKSHSTNTNGIIYNDILTLANGTSFIQPESVSADLSSLVWGHNGAPTMNTGAYVYYPTDNGEVIETIFQREWKSQETGVIGTVTLEFDLSNVIGVGGAIGINDLANLRLLVDEDGDYSDGFATSIVPSSYDNVTNIAYFEHDFTPPFGPESTELRGFFFTLGSTNAATTPLPVELVNFEVERLACSNTISWSTLSETNSDYYLIEYSHDSENWIPVGQVNAAGNSQVELDYSYRHDGNFDEGTYYYRLTQVDINGSRYHYDPVAVYVACNSKLNEPIIYPNPTNGILYIIFGHEGEINIADVNGREVMRKSISKGKSTLNLNTISSGMYVITIFSSNGRVIAEKLIKQ